MLVLNSIYAYLREELFSSPLAGLSHPELGTMTCVTFSFREVLGRVGTPCHQTDLLRLLGIMAEQSVLELQ